MSSSIIDSFTCDDHSRHYVFFCPVHLRVLCDRCTITFHHRYCHLLVLDSELDDPYYSCLVIKLYESISKIVQRLQCVFKNVHKPNNDNDKNQQATNTTTSSTNAEIKEFNINNNHTRSSESTDTANTDSTEIAITDSTESQIAVTDEIKHNTETTDFIKVTSSMYAGNNESANDKMQKYKELETAINLRVALIQSMNISKCRLVAMAVVHKLLFVLEKQLTSFVPYINILEQYISLFKEFKMNEFHVESISDVINSSRNIALTLIKRITIPKGDASSVITNCFFMPNKEIVVIDTANRKLHIYDKHGAFHRSIILYGKPRDATPASKNLVVVRYHDWNWFELFDISDCNNMISKKLPICRRVVFRNEIVFDSYDGGCNIDVHRASGAIITSMSTERKSIFSHITTYGNRVYFIDRDQTTIRLSTGDKTCKLNWFTYVDIIEKNSITSGRNGYVFVTEYCRNKLLVLNFDFKLKKEVILYGLDRSINLTGVCIDRQNNKLFVCSADGLAYLYDVHIPYF